MDEQEKHGPFHRDTTPFMFSQMNWEGTKYIGMDIDIDRKNQLFQTIRPNGTKEAGSLNSKYRPYNASYSRSEKGAPICDRDVTILLSDRGSIDINSSPRTRICSIESYYQGYAQNGTTIAIPIHSQKLWNPLLRIKYAVTSSIQCALSQQTTRKAINGSLACASKMISCIVASAAEAELAAGFQQAQIAVRLRNTLMDLGYPQLPTLLLIDKYKTVQKHGHAFLLAS
jgi:hypothetical protein